MIAHEYHILYRETKSTGNHEPIGPILSVTACAQGDGELRLSLEAAALQVISITELRPLVDWSKPYFNREEFAHLVGWKSLTVSRKRGAGTIPRSEFRPRFECAPLSAGLKWVGGHGFRFEEKLDGCWHVTESEGNTIVGERLRDGRLFAFDIVRLAGEDVRQWPLRERLKVLDGFNLLRPAHGSGGEFLASVLAGGGEGVVMKHLDAPFGVGWRKCKRIETFDCVVIEKDGWRGSIRLMLDGEECGWCPARRFFDEIAVGDVVEVAALRRNASGKLREPRLLRLRRDKQVQSVTGLL